MTTDAAFIVLQSLISRMEELADGPYRIEHDRSKNLLTYHGLLQRYIGHNHNVEFQQSEIVRIKYPLKLKVVKQVDSKSSPAVQIADVMIGATIEATEVLAVQRKAGLDGHAVLEAYGPDQFIHLLPSTDFEAQQKFRSGAQANEMLDSFVKNFHCS